MQFMAASTQTPTFVIAGAADLIVWGPLGSRSQVIQARLPQDQSFFKISKLEKETWMYRSLSVEEVLTALRGFMVTQKII
jgi:hypothetical protein